MKKKRIPDGLIVNKKISNRINDQTLTNAQIFIAMILEL